MFGRFGHRHRFRDRNESYRLGGGGLHALGPTVCFVESQINDVPTLYPYPRTPLGGVNYVQPNVGPIYKLAVFMRLLPPNCALAEPLVLNNR